MTEPTDAEIWQMWMPMVRRIGVADPVEFARAVLAKWGTPPAVAGEPVAWRYVPSKVWGEFVYTEDPKRAQHARDNGIDVQPVFTTPQPTQAQAGAVPLTDEQIERDRPMMVEPAAYAEKHHGIKGGQHE